ncbi:AAA family ATPase [uncultured Tateyamaria sp.]|uniref:AAA family ATPase n=1 Tax=uncultured Tateyamaria sp. TaxID=455651 RepID=UPI00262381C3|nr:AAA family ATPase [uncultured Tateyamaria sp.]
MFEKDGLNALYTAHRYKLGKVNAVADALNKRFYKMEDAVECLMIAAMSGEAMVMIGPPGTAKSRLMRSFCNLLELIPDTALTGGKDERKPDDPSHEAYFEYLLTQFTEPSELFGFYDLEKLSAGEGLVRDDQNMMHKAQVVFLDEVFNASSAILNSLLTFMNERKFHDRGKVIPTPLRLLVSATNHPPQDPTLGAVYDRFLLRCRVENIASEGVEQEDVVQLLQAGWQETHATELDNKPDCKGLLEDLQRLQDDVDARTKSGSLKIDPAHPMFANLTQMVSTMIKYELSEMSNRRIIKLAGLALSLRLLRADREGDDEIEMQARDLDVIARFSLDREDPSGQKRLSEDLDLS